MALDISIWTTFLALTLGDDVAFERVAIAMNELSRDYAVQIKPNYFAEGAISWSIFFDLTKVRETSTWPTEGENDSTRLRLWETRLNAAINVSAGDLFQNVPTFKNVDPETATEATFVQLQPSTSDPVRVACIYHGTRLVADFTGGERPVRFISPLEGIASTTAKLDVSLSLHKTDVHVHDDIVGVMHIRNAGTIKIVLLPGWIPKPFLSRDGHALSQTSADSTVFPDRFDNPAVALDPGQVDDEVFRIAIDPLSLSGYVRLTNSGAYDVVSPDFSARLNVTCNTDKKEITIDMDPSSRRLLHVVANGNRVLTLDDHGDITTSGIRPGMQSQRMSIEEFIPSRDANHIVCSDDCMFAAIMRKAEDGDSERNWIEDLDLLKGRKVATVEMTPPSKGRWVPIGFDPSSNRFFVRSLNELLVVNWASQSIEKRRAIRPHTHLSADCQHLVTPDDAGSPTSLTISDGEDNDSVTIQLPRFENDRCNGFVALGNGIVAAYDRSGQLWAWHYHAKEGFECDAGVGEMCGAVDEEDRTVLLMKEVQAERGIQVMRMVEILWPTHQSNVRVLELDLAKDVVLVGNPSRMIILSKHAEDGKVTWYERMCESVDVRSLQRDAIRLE